MHSCNISAMISHELCGSQTSSAPFSTLLTICTTWSHMQFWSQTGDRNWHTHTPSFFIATNFLSFLQGYITLYPVLCLIIQEALLHTHAQAAWKRKRGRDIKAAYKQSTDAKTCAERDGLRRWSQRGDIPKDAYHPHLTSPKLVLFDTHMQTDLNPALSINEKNKTKTKLE